MKATTSSPKKSIRYKGSNKALTINLIVVIIVGIFSGFMIGMWLISNKVDPNLYNMNATLLMDDVSKIRNEANGKTPEELGATKSCVLAFDNTFNHKNVMVVGVGNVNAMGVNQSINSKSIRIGDSVFTEGVSVSKFVKAADRFYLENGTITKVKGNVDGNTITWNGDKSNMTPASYAETMGGSINEYMLHIVSSKTVVNASDVSKLSNGNYTFTLELDKVKSVIRYVKNMKATGGLSSYPVFSENIKLTVTIDSNFRLVEVTSEEKYSAKIGVLTAKSKGTLTNKFTYDGDFTIPQISENTII